jgi:ADP-ribose pyrophosphatase YjhB (NUDIX family)
MPAPIDARQAALYGHLRDLSEEKKAGLSPGHLAEMLNLLGSSGSALSREHFEPGHFTASAFVLSAAGDELLLIFHRKLKLWLQPGGHIEAEDEDLVSAATRELMEETSLQNFAVEDPLFDLDVHEIPAWGDTPSHKHFDVRVLFRATDGNVRAGDDVLLARWFPLEVLAEKRTSLAEGYGSDESVRSAAERLLALRDSRALP